MAHRRQRHLNPKHAGAAIAVDARFIKNLNNNDPVVTWYDRTGSHNFTQGAAVSRPLFIARALNGQPSTFYDGSNDNLDNSTFGSPNGLTQMTMMHLNIPGSLDNATNMQYMTLGWRESGGWGITGLKSLAARVNYRYGTGQGGNDNYYTRPSSKQGLGTITTAVKNGINEQLYIDGSLVSSSSSKLSTLANNVTLLTIGAYGELNTRVSNSISFVLIARTFFYPNIRKRIEHCVARSYKLKCD